MLKTLTKKLRRHSLNEIHPFHLKVSLTYLPTIGITVEYSTTIRHWLYLSGHTALKYTVREPQAKEGEISLFVNSVALLLSCDLKLILYAALTLWTPAVNLA